MDDVTNWMYVVDRVNEKILRIPEWKNEINVTLKSTDLFIDGIIGMIVSYADYEILSKTFFNVMRYDYRLFGGRVGIKLLQFDEGKYMLSRQGASSLSMITSFLNYQSRGGSCVLGELKKSEMTPENIVRLFVSIHQYESEGRFFDILKLEECKNILNCEEYFVT